MKALINGINWFVRPPIKAVLRFMKEKELKRSQPTEPGE